MRLEQITAEIRPRTKWESVDLGIALVRQHFKKLAQIWLITTVPIWALCILILRDHPLWCFLLIIYLRPLYERPILHFLSRALFNAPPQVKDIVRNWPKIVRPGLLYGLTVARFSLSRSFLMPLHVLEGIKGEQYRLRRTALSRTGGGTGLTFACILLEFVLVTSLIFLIVGFIPQQMAPDWGEMFTSFFSFDGVSAGLPPALAWFAIGVFLVAISFVELFYVGCGFALYLNGRSHIEGWDIEITFRRLAARVHRAAHALAALTLVTLVIAGEAEAADPIKEEISEILADEDFTIHKRTIKVPTGPETSDGASSGLGVVAAFGQLVFWAVIALGVGLIVWAIYANRHLFNRNRARQKPDAPTPKTRTVMGLDIASETLPDDIPAAALAAWNQGDAQLATSLLYRGAISWLVESANLPLHGSDTESDCVNHSSKLPDIGQRRYFSELTGEWIRIAYSEALPTDAVIRKLCEAWPFEQGQTPRS